MDREASYLHRDQRASVQAISNDLGQRATRRQYRPFGEISWEVIDGPTADEAHGSIGERYDEGAGLQYLNARYYDPELGLFLQPDWFEVTKAGVGTNRYAYSFNDPVNARDPGGNACITSMITQSPYCGRAIKYAGYHQELGGKTYFFAAASRTVWLFGALDGVGENYTDKLSEPTEQIYRDKSAMLERFNGGLFRYAQETALSGEALDQRLVHLEQTAVQTFLDDFRASDPAGFESFIAEANSFLNSSTSTSNLLIASIFDVGGRIGGDHLKNSDRRYILMLRDIQENFGGTIDYRVQAHREAIGRALADEERRRDNLDFWKRLLGRDGD